MPAFVHSACVFGSFVPANAGPLNATTRPKANIETSVFIAVSSIARCFGCGNNRMALHRFLGCFWMSREISSQRQFVESAHAAARAQLRGWSIHLQTLRAFGFGRRPFYRPVRGLADSNPRNPSLRDGLLLSWPIEVSQQSELKGHRMTKQFDVAKIARLTEIKEDPRLAA
jgi:hypothetical protein